MGHDVIVVGAGAIGLAVARELATDHSVLMLERGAPGREASWAAAGMLCPHGEASTDDALFRLGLSSLRLYRSFVRDLVDETGVDAEYRDDGTLVIGSTDQEWADLERRYRWQQASGRNTRLLEPHEVRSLEPGITLNIQGALHCPTDHQIDPRLLLESLRASAAIRGVDIRSGVHVDAIRRRNGRVDGVCAGELIYDAPNVVVASGAWSGRLAGLDPAVETCARKGQILSLRMPGARFRHVIRWGQFYLAPRRNGRLIVGATNEDSGFDRRVTATGMRQLLDAAHRMAADVDAYEVVETWTGLRPATPDGLPVIGQADLAGLYYAFGHYRNGILLTPLTAKIIGQAVRGTEGESFAAFAPGRFRPGKAAPATRPQLPGRDPATAEV